jgi:Cdc6-like AAA superfamily ATPase
MLNTRTGKILAKIVGGENNGKLICCDENCKNGFDEIILDDNEKSVIRPLLDMENRSVNYIAGPSGSGKTSYAVNLIKDYLKVYPKTDFFLFSRTDYHNDPVYKGMKIAQIKIDENLIENPIDIEQELSERSLLFFDDCNTIQNTELKKYVEGLIEDIMEVGRKLNITIIVTNHLVIPNERKFARTVLNEIQSLTVYPKSGTTQQISYALKTYFGINKKDIEKILGLNSRWVTVIRNYPMTVLYERGVYIL